MALSPRMTPARIALLILIGTLVPTLHAEDVKTTVTGVHLCCGGCRSGMTEAIEKAGAHCVVADVKGSIYPDKRGQLTITAKDKAGMEKALLGLTDAGYHGVISESDFTMPDNSGAPDSSVNKLKLTGAHLCCNKCAKSLLTNALAVSGVNGHDITRTSKEFTITGSFNAKALVKAINDAGFHVKVVK